MMDPHIKMVIEETLPRAKALVEEGERRLLAQAARVGELKRRGLDTQQSAKLLKIMHETHAHSD